MESSLYFLQGLVWAWEVYYDLHQGLVGAEEVDLQGLVWGGEVSIYDILQGLIRAEGVDFWLA